MSQLPISLVVNVSVAQVPTGLGEFNVNNLILFTDDVPSAAPSDGFGIFLAPEGVSTLYGSGSQTAAMANEIFAQSPNILAGGGSLIVAPLLLGLSGVTAVQKLTFSATPASGAYVLNYGSHASASIPWNDNATSLQVALRLVTGLGSVTVTGTVGAGFIITFVGVDGPVAPLTVSSNTVLDSGSAGVTLTVVTTTPGRADGSTETLVDAIQRLQPLVSFCGILKTDSYVTNELSDAAVYAQTQSMIIFAQSSTSADVNVTTGIFWQIMNAGLSKTRCLMYLEDDYAAAGQMAAAYAGRALSTNFSGSNTTQNMQLKSLLGILADTGMTLDIYNKCQVAGVDVYGSLNGVGKVLASGANKYFDQVYNLMWFTTSIQVAVFNAEAETPTKIPQTEQGVSILTSAAQQICDQSTINLYVAPGVWSGGTFGNQQDFLRNIRDVGYYIFTQPIAKQSQADRAARKAPLMQIAIKEAGGVDSESILVVVTP